MDYIATFYSHYGAIRYHSICKDLGIASKMMPVPRSLSSSCGTCVSYQADRFDIIMPIPEEVEQIAVKDGKSYELLYKAENA